MSELFCMYEIVLSFKISLFIQFIQSWKQREFVYLACLKKKKSLLVIPQKYVVHL